MGGSCHLDHVCQVKVYVPMCLYAIAEARISPGAGLDLLLIANQPVNGAGMQTARDGNVSRSGVN